MTDDPAKCDGASARPLTDDRRVGDSVRNELCTKEHIQNHRDGSLWARGQTLDGVATGYWEWFRRDGTRLRSGSFENGEQVGEWTTYDKNGDVYKVTTIRPKSKATSGYKTKPKS